MSKLIRINKQTWEILKQRQERMDKDFFQLTGKQRKLPITKVVEVSVKSPKWLDPSELKKLYTKRVFRV